MPSQDAITVPTMEANGALAPQASTHAALPAAATQVAAPSPKHQTDGSYTPITGPITSVRQLVRGGRSVAKGSVESFSSLDTYTTYLRKLTTAELHRHALEAANIVPIDDSSRLIRRLENNWTEISARERGRLGESSIPKRADFTQEQKEAQENLRRKMLAGRG